MARSVRSRGFTLIEMMIAVAIIGVMSALAVPAFQSFFDDQRVKQAARSVADVLSFARNEAIRTGRNHIVYIQQDPTGALLLDARGVAAPVMLVQDDDGAGPLPAPNGQLDAGERRIPVSAQAGVNWGVTFATVAAPGDTGLVANFTTGRTFRTPAGAAARWVVFRPDGLPRAYSTGPYTEGVVGTGGGGVYLTNGRRDYAILLSPLGGVQVSLWNRSLGQWRN